MEKLVKNMEWDQEYTDYLYFTNLGIGTVIFGMAFGCMVSDKPQFYAFLSLPIFFGVLYLAVRKIPSHLKMLRELRKEKDGEQVIEEIREREKDLGIVAVFTKYGVFTYSIVMYLMVLMYPKGIQALAGWLGL